MWNLVTHFTCDNFNNIEFKERPPDSASACEWLGNFLINNKNYKTDKWFWTPNSANYEIDFLSPNDQNKKNNPLGVAAGQLKNDKIFLVSYLICYLPCPRTAFPVFYYLSLPSYLFVHSRTFSSLFYLNTFRNEMIWDLLIWQFYSFSLDADQTFFS